MIVTQPIALQKTHKDTKIKRTVIFHLKELTIVLLSPIARIIHCSYQT